MPLKVNPETGLLDLVGDPGSAGGAVDSVTGDSGGTVSPDVGGDMGIIGDATQGYLTTIGTPASNKLEVKLLEPAADGELLIGHTANAEPSVATLTGGSGITITNGAGSITVAADTSDDLTVPTDSGTATSVASSLSIVGGTGADTVGSGSTVTINASASVPTAFTTDSGTGTPAGNSLAVNGGTGINTSGAGAGVTVNLDDPVIVAQGGSGRQSATAYGIITGGTTSTAAHQSIASVGTSGQLLTSNGAGALPSMQAGPAPESLTTALTAGSVVFSDGTNLTEDNANFFWDDTNNRLGIGTTTPDDELHVVGGIDLVHTAVAADEHALDIVCDAAGFGDVKALEIDYVTGALSAVSEDGVILVNIDETASLGGEVFGIEINATAEGSAVVYGTKHGATVNPIFQQSGVFADADTILNKAVDVTAALADGGAGNISVFVADDDTLTVGDAATYGELEIIIDTGASGAGIAPTFEYSLGVGTWAVFTPTDGTDGFKVTGLISWDVGNLTSWAVGTGSEYLIRITRTKNSLSTTPIVDEIQKAAITEYIWDKSGLININKIVAQTNLTVGNATEDTSFTVNAASITSTISAESTNSSDLGGLISHRHSATAGYGGHYLGLRSRGTHSSPTVVQSGDVLSIIAAAGHDGTDYALSGQISVEVDGTPGSDDMPGRIILATSADGAQSPIEGIRLDSSQIVTLANALPETSGGTNQTTYTTGDILYSDASNSLEKLGIGSTGELLTVAAGIPSWAAAAGGGGGDWTQITQSTPTGVSEVEITSGLGTAYDEYLVMMMGIEATTNATLDLLFSDNAGSTYTVDYRLNELARTGSTVSYSRAESNSLTIATASSGSHVLNAWASWSLNKHSIEKVLKTWGARNGQNDRREYKGILKSTNDIDAIKITVASGDFDAGTITLFGR